MEHLTEPQELDAPANLAAMQRTARERLDAGTFYDYPAAEPQDGIGGA